MTRKFAYRPRSAEDYEKQTAQRGYRTVSPFPSDVRMYRPKDGPNCIRILPPTWEDTTKYGTHYGIELYLHYGIGPDRAVFVSRRAHLGDPADPIAREINRLEREFTGREPPPAKKKQIMDLRAKKRYLVWLIDRNEDDAGPQLYAMPYTLDVDICARARDPRTREVLNVDDPYNGYDVFFSREKGRGGFPSYVGVQLDRAPSYALGTEEATTKFCNGWLTQNSLDKQFRIATVEEMVAELHGVGAGDEPEEVAPAGRAWTPGRGEALSDALPSRAARWGAGGSGDEEDAPPARAAARTTRRASEPEQEEEEDVPPARASRHAPDPESEVEEEDVPPARAPTRASRRAPEPEPEPEPEEEDAPPARTTTRTTRRAPEPEEDAPPARATRRAPEPEPEEEDSAPAAGADLDRPRGRLADSVRKRFGR